MMAWRSLSKWTVYLIIGGVLASVIGEQIGIAAANSIKERMGLVWIDVMSFAEVDRALLVNSATKCQLVRVKLERAAVIECLRSGAQSIDAESGEKQAASRIERLLDVADRF